MARFPPLLALLLLVHPLAGSAHPAAPERIEILNQRIDARPKDPEPYLARGAVHSHEGNYELALADFRKAEQLTEPVVVAYQLGVLHHRMGDLAAARTSLDAFLARFPNHAPALEERARVLGALGETGAAVADYERLFAVQSTPNPGSYISAAQLLAAEGDAGVGGAIELLDAGIERLGVIPQLQRYAIELELQRGKDENALARLELLKPALGESPDWKVDMGELLLQMDRPEEARVFLADASSQLGTLKETPARRRLARRIATILAGIADAPAGD